MTGKINFTLRAIRSLSQGLNPQKREPSIQPHELLGQEYKMVTHSTTDNLECFLNQLLQLTSNDNKDFMQNISLNTICTHCEQTN